MQDFKANTLFEEDIVQLLKDNGLVNNNLAYQTYTLRHKQAFLAVMYSLTGYITQSAIMHDTDKLYTYGRVSKDETSRMHRKYAIHHIENSTKTVNKLDCIIDYECARFTKPDKPLNAYATIMKFRPHTYDILKSTLIELGLDSDENIAIDFSKWYQVCDRIYTMMKQDIIKRISFMKSIENTEGLEEAEKEFYAKDFLDKIIF